MSGWSWPPGWPSSATPSSVSTAAPASSGALCSGDVPIREAGLAELVARGLQSGRLTFTTCIRLRHPAGRVHLPGGRYAGRPVRGGGPAEHSFSDPVDRGQPERSHPDHRQQEHVTDRHRRDDRGYPRARARGPPGSPSDRQQPRVPAPGHGRRRFLPPGPDRHRRPRQRGCRRGGRAVFERSAARS